MEDITDQVIAMDKALSSALMNTECSDPIVAVISLSKLLCELLVELGMDDDEQARPLSVTRLKTSAMNTPIKRFTDD